MAGLRMMNARQPTVHHMAGRHHAVTSVVCDVRRTAEVVTVIEEYFFLCGVVWNVTVTNLRVIRVARIIPAYRSRPGLVFGVVLGRGV